MGPQCSNQGVDSRLHSPPLSFPKSLERRVEEAGEAGRLPSPCSWCLGQDIPNVKGNFGPCPLLLSPQGAIFLPSLDFPGDSEGKESACNAGDPGSIPGSGRSPGEGNGLPLQYSCLESPHGQRGLAGYSPGVPKS